MDDVYFYLRTNYLHDVANFMSVHGSEFHDGLNTEDAIEAFIAFTKSQQPQPAEPITPPPAKPVITNTGDEPPPGMQPPPTFVDENPPTPYDRQPPSTFVPTTETTPGLQPIPENIK